MPSSPAEATPPQEPDGEAEGAWVGTPPMEMPSDYDDALSEAEGAAADGFDFGFYGVGVDGFAVFGSGFEIDVIDDDVGA